VSLWAAGFWASGFWADGLWSEDDTPVAPNITTTSLPNGSEGVAYARQINVSGSTPITWSLDTPIPSGWSISPTGVVSSALPAPGTISLRIRATNDVDTDLQIIAFTIVEADEFQSAPPAARVWRVVSQRTLASERLFRRRMDGLAWAVLAVGDVTNVGLDYADELDDGELIIASDWTMPAAVVGGAEGVDGAIASTWITVAAIGNHALVNTVVTDRGNTFNRTLMVDARLARS
jgi:hypothetical protein